MCDSTFRRPRRGLVLGCLLLLSAPGVLAGTAAAQPPPAQPGSPAWSGGVPARIGNRWDSLSHQPTQADVGAAEQELGLPSSAEHNRAVDNELQELGNQLLNAEQNDPALRGR